METQDSWQEFSWWEENNNPRDVGEDLAESIVNGEIYVLGKIESLGKNAFQMKAKDEDIKELKQFSINMILTYLMKIIKILKIIPQSKRPFFHKKTKEENKMPFNVIRDPLICKRDFERPGYCWYLCDDRDEDI